MCSHDALSPVRKEELYTFLSGVGSHHERGSEGYTFNWAKMLSNNLTKEIVDYKTSKSKGKPAPFYMSTYVMDVIHS